ncbi:hypothetical protein LINGRAHAP2_LOCUS27921 [Linum grandiflorum]
MAQHLWGYEGTIPISRLSAGSYLLEFPSLSLCDWVLSKSLHIHHSALLLRRWEPNIQPIEIVDEEIPIWVTFKAVPSQLITAEGIGWIASRIGTPVREEQGLFDISIVVQQERDYTKTKVRKLWKPKQSPTNGTAQEVEQRVDPKSSLEEKGSPDSTLVPLTGGGARSSEIPIGVEETPAPNKDPM